VSKPRHRFVVPPRAVDGGRVHFSAAAARQMRRVLRLSPGDIVAALDGQGTEYRVTLVSLRDNEAIGTIEEQRTLDSEPRLAVTLFQALLPREKFEHVLQKSTEVGVRRIVPLATERSLVPAAAVSGSRLVRWRRIVQEASEQAGRAVLPDLEEPLSLAEALEQRKGQPALLAWEQEASLSLRQALLSLRPRLGDGLGIFVGPEGGFSQVEAQAAREAGVTVVSLGPLILRAETAGPVLAAVALYEAGDLEPR
jgi:16S rRNA (uracil1498-N3)-methyltransferase